MSVDDFARKMQGTRAPSDPRWGEDTCTDITRRFVPDEDDPTVRASPEFTEALLSSHGELRAAKAARPAAPAASSPARAAPVSSAVNARPPRSGAQPARWADEPSVSASGDSRWADASISIRMESLLADDPALATAIAQLRSGDRPSGVVNEPARVPAPYTAAPNDDRTAVDGWANRSDATHPDVPREASFNDATDVDPVFSSEWLPRAPRVPAEFARTAPPRPGGALRRRGAFAVVKVVLAGALLTALSFFLGRMHYDLAFRARVTTTVLPVWNGAASRVAELDRWVRGRPPAAPTPDTLRPAKRTPDAPRVSTLAAKPEAPATPDAPPLPSMRVYRIDELPLEACTDGSCDSESPKKGPARRRAF